jgi:uncharacterized protein
VRSWITKWPAVSFYLLMLALSWGYWLALLAQGQHVEPGNGVTHFPGLLGPMLAAMAVTAAIEGRSGLRELFARMIRLRPHWPLKLTPALSPLALMAAALVALRSLGKPTPSVDDFSNMPGLPPH